VTVPPAVVTTTFAKPAVPAGVFPVIVEPLSVTTVKGAPPMVTVAPERLVPVMVMGVPPDVGPEDGLTVAMVGAVLTLKALESTGLVTPLMLLGVAVKV